MVAQFAAAAIVPDGKALMEAFPMPWDDQPETEPASEDEVAVALAQLEDDVRIGGDDD